jgi:hypothetical protein
VAGFCADAVEVSVATTSQLGTSAPANIEVNLQVT